MNTDPDNTTVVQLDDATATAPHACEAAKHSRKKLRRVIAATAVMLLLSVVLTAQAFGYNVFQTIIQWFDQYVSFTSDAPSTELINLEPSYIPEGFHEDSRSEPEAIATIIYRNEDGERIVFISMISSAYLAVSNDEREYQQVQINGIDFHMFLAVDEKPENKIVWESDNQRYSLSSTMLSIDELVKIAFSVGK